MNHTAADRSTLYVPNCITNTEIKSSFHLKNEIENRGVLLVARLLNAFFGERIMYVEIDDTTKKPVRMMVRKTKNRQDSPSQVYKYVLDDSFVKTVDMWVRYFKGFHPVSGEYMFIDKV